MDDYLDEILAKLDFVDDLHYKKMFGGVGIYAGIKMFALISSQKVFHLKVNDETRIKYEAEEMAPLTSAKKAGKGMPYFTVPDSVYNDKREFKTRVLQSIEIAYS